MAKVTNVSDRINRDMSSVVDLIPQTPKKHISAHL